MQRRAAAGYVALFLVIAVGAYGLAVTAESPEITLEDPEYDVEEGDQFEAEGVTYTLTEVTRDDGVPTGTLEWNITVDEEESWEHGDVIEYQESDYEVLIPNETDPSEFTLREEPGDDLDVRGEGDDRVIRVEEDGEEEFVPIDEYEPLDRQTFAEGDAIEYDEHDATVAEVTEDEVRIEWTEEATDDLTLREGLEVAQLSEDQTYIAHFTAGDRLQLTSDHESYNEQADEIAYFEERTDGLTVATILSGLTAFLLVGMAYLPRKE
ncbi:hypothetical protein [Natranaeroarchaeum sulfidigenes]|uniref:Putative membrane protein n=1 Tax=Natranaeroarchaeum sulfidigenes TaxID=2784880 RepID=A0A897MRG8_9EURY|nr:hypothetical protein [Natranaeroarchaeum sulfidigenes]QSG01569.1 putative membrane protein [Natranaeroarchaeum sulfidigenes]